MLDGMDEGNFYFGLCLTLGFNLTGYLWGVVILVVGGKYVLIAQEDGSD